MGEILPQENSIRTSTYRSSDTYDPARKSLQLINYQTLLTFALMLISITSWGQTIFTGTGNWTDAARWGGALPGPGASVIIDGTCTLNISSVTVEDITINGSLDAGANILRVEGDWNNQGTFIAGTSTVIMQGAAISDVTFEGTTAFYNLQSVAGDKYNISIGVSPASSVTVANVANLNIANDLNIIGNSFNINTGTIAIGRNLNIDPTSVFTPGTSTVLFTSAGTSTITGNCILYNLAVNKPGGTFNFPANTVVTNNISLINGTANAGTAIAPIRVGGSFTDSPTANFIAGTSTIEFTGTSANVPVSADQPFYNVIVSKTGGSIAVASNVTMQNMNVQSTPNAAACVIFSTAGVTMNVQGDLGVTTGTIDMSVSDDTYLRVAGNTTVNGGRIFIYRLDVTSELVLNGGLTISSGSVEVGPVTGPPALSKLTVTGLTQISETGKLITNTTSTVDLKGNVELSTGTGSRFDAFNSKIDVTGNWQSSLPVYFGAGTSTVKFIGNTHTQIRENSSFANLIIEKSAGATVTYTNTSTISNLLINKNLLIQSGTLILTNIPMAVDMALKGDLTIIKDASVDIGNPNIVVEIGGNLEDQNTAEPTNTTPRRGLYIGMNPAHPMGVRSCTPGGYTTQPVQALPTIRFNGTTEQRITGYVPLRTYCGGFYPKNGIALPNIEILKTDTVRLNSDVNVRIHGNLNIVQGGFNLSSQILYFGDHENDEINILPGGTFTVPEASQIFMNTGTTSNGTFLKVNGGALKFLGKANNPVVITREGTVGQYYRMAAYSGTVEAIYTTISYQGSSNTGFLADNSLPADAITYGSAGGFKIYSSAVIDPYKRGYNFSYCVLGANAAGGTTSLTINSGQDLEIVGTVFNTSGSGGINITKNNPNGIITFFRSSGELGGVNGEFYDGGYYADPNGIHPEGVVWETYPRMYWIANTYDNRPDTDPSVSVWGDARNWSLDPTIRVNPYDIYPGQPVTGPVGGQTVAPDYLQQFEVFICASARTSPVLDGNYVIQGTVINNSVGRFNSFDLSPANPSLTLTRSGKTLNLNGFTLTVWGDLVNNNRDADGNTLPNSNARINVNPGGTIRFRANLASFHSNSMIDGGTGFVLEAFDNNPLQEIKIAANDLQEFIINKPEGRVVVQGFGSDRLDVRRNLTILSGGMEMLTNTPLLVDGNFTISGGFFTFNSSIAIIRGNWNNTGGTINTGGGIVYFYPSDNTTKIVRSGGQSFNQVNFGMINNTTGALATPNTPESPALTRYRIVDHFTASNLVTIAARGEINGANYDDTPAISTANPAQPRIVEVEANVTVRANGMRVRENGELILNEGATLLISNNLTDFTIDNYNPFPASLNPLGLRIEGAASTFPNGKLTAIGTADNYVKISRNGISGVYNFKVNGTLSNRYYLFEFMDANGVDLTATTSTTISPGTATIPNNGAAGTQTVNVSSFSDGILTNGTIGGVYIRYTHNAAIFGAAPDTIYNVNFPVPLTDGLGIGANIRRTGATCATIASGVLWFRNATGAFAGEDFDDDGSACGLLDQIQWRQPQIRRWDGGMGTLPFSGDNFWHNPVNWIPNGVPLPDEDVVLDHTYVPESYTVDIDNTTGDVVVNNLTIITKTDNVNPIILQVTNSKLTINKGFTVDVPATPITSGKLILATNALMEVGENWSNKGSFIPNTAPVIFGANYRGSRVIFNVKPTLPTAYNPATNLEPSKYTDNVFHKIIMKSGRTELNSDLMVKDSLIINQGAKLDNSSSSDPQSILQGPNGIHPNTILIEGNWVNNGRFFPTDGTVNFVGLNHQILVQQDTVTENFYKLKIEKLFNANNLAEHRNVTLWSKATVSNELNLQRGRFITLPGRELILLTDNIIRNSSAHITTAYVQGPLGQLYKGIGEIRHKFALGDVLWPGDFAYLTVKLTSASTDRGTVFTMQQIDSDPDPSSNPNPSFANDPAPYGDDRILPRPLNFLSRSRYWNVKNIMFPVTKPTEGLNADMVNGRVELPLAVQNEDATVTTSNGWVTTPNQTLAQVLSELQELSIVQDTATANTAFNPLYPSAPLSTQVDRGWANKGERWGDLGGELNVRESGGAIKATYISNTFYQLGNGDFAFAWNYIPLPVEFLNLQASRKGEAVTVKWMTASEKNIIHFVVERSSNGVEFTKIGMTDAKANSNTITSYVFTDLSPLSGTSYYRVYSVDMFGTAQYSKVVTVTSSDELKTAITDALQVFPNPFDGRSINFSIASHEGAMQAVISDMLGKQVYTHKMQNYTHELINIQLDTPLAPGMYVLQILTEKGIYKKKIVVK
jgi:hypothetical protein